MLHHRLHHRQRRLRRGVVLLIVLVVVVVLALAAYVFCELSISHRRAANAVGRRLQAEAFAESGVQFTLRAVSEAVRRGSERELYESPDLFQGVTVVTSESPRERGGFTVISPAHNENGEVAGIRFGLEDESNRLNLNLLKAIADSQEELGQQVLMALPGMTLEIADSILDWLDADDEPRPYGVESDYYAMLHPPYAAANRELTSIAELLLVRGVTRQLLFGQDQNQNFLLEPAEAALYGATTADRLSELSPFGWAAHLTLYSRDREQDEDQQGEQAVNVNQDDMQNLYDELMEQFSNKEWAMFIVAFRQNGPYDGASTLDSATTRDLDLTQPARFPVTQALDLIGQNVEVTLAGDSEPIVLASPFKDDPPSLAYNLGELQGRLILSGHKLPGRINIMTAPPVVLRTIPGIDDTIVEAILDHREILASQSDGEIDELWPFTEGIVTLAQMRAIAPFINVGGAVFRAQILGHFSEGGHATRTEVVIDASGGQPRVVLRRGLTHLGNGALLSQISSAAQKYQLPPANHR